MHACNYYVQENSRNLYSFYHVNCTALIDAVFKTASCTGVILFLPCLQIALRISVTSQKVTSFLLSVGELSIGYLISCQNDI